MLNKSQLFRIDQVLIDSMSYVKQNETRDKLGVLSIDQLIALENCKFGFKLNRKLLPAKVMQSVQTDSVGNSLTKTHQYATRKKDVLNVPKVINSQYLNSILCKGPKFYGDLNQNLKNVINYNTFISKCKKELLTNKYLV